MAVPTLAQFRGLFAEFDQAPDALVQQCIDEAARQTPESLWHERQEDGIYWLAADLVARRPNAKEMRIQSTGATLYRARRDELESIVYTGPLVVGRW